jgi:hypothetical protein
MAWRCWSAWSLSCTAAANWRRWDNTERAEARLRRGELPRAFVTMSHCGLPSIANLIAPSGFAALLVLLRWTSLLYEKLLLSCSGGFPATARKNLTPQAGSKKQLLSDQGYC